MINYDNKEIFSAITSDNSPVADPFIACFVLLRDEGDCMTDSNVTPASSLPNLVLIHEDTSWKRG